MLLFFAYLSFSMFHLKYLFLSYFGFNLLYILTKCNNSIPFEICFHFFSSFRSPLFIEKIVCQFFPIFRSKCIIHRIRPRAHTHVYYIRCKSIYTHNRIKWILRLNVFRHITRFLLLFIFLFCCCLQKYTLYTISVTFYVHRTFCSFVINAWASFMRLLFLTKLLCCCCVCYWIKSSTSATYIQMAEIEKKKKKTL